MTRCCSHAPSAPNDSARFVSTALATLAGMAGGAFKVLALDTRIANIAAAAPGRVTSSTRATSGVPIQGKYKEYALNPYCPARARDLVDCLSEKMFAGSKCKAEMEVEADE